MTKKKQTNEPAQAAPATPENKPLVESPTVQAVKQNAKPEVPTSDEVKDSIFVPSKGEKEASDIKEKQEILEKASTQGAERKGLLEQMREAENLEKMSPEKQDAVEELVKDLNPTKEDLKDVRIIGEGIPEISDALSPGEQKKDGNSEPLKSKEEDKKEKTERTHLKRHIPSSLSLAEAVDEVLTLMAGAQKLDAIQRIEYIIKTHKGKM